MALKRTFLKDLGIESDIIDKIIAEHTNTVEGIKGDLDNKNEELKTANSKIKQLEKSTNGDVDLTNYVKKEDYDQIKGEYDTFKTDIANKETLASKKAAYINEVLKAENINDKRHESIVKLFDFSTLELDDKGKIKDLDKLKENAKSEWADFIVTTETKGTDIATPPNNEEAKKDPIDIASAIRFEQQNNQK